MQPDRIKIGTRAYKKLETVANMLASFSANNVAYEVSDTYFDYGQDWMWTTIIAFGKDGSWQVLSPKEWEEIILAVSVKELADVTEKIMAGKYFLDR